MKKIVLATNIGGSLETVIDSKTGFLVKNNDTEDFADKISLALSLNPEQSEQMGENARKNILEKFTNEKMFDSTISIYKELLIQS